MKDYIPILVIGLIVLGLVFSNNILNLFRLDQNDTVYDFYTADAETAVDWMMRMCSDGEYLDHKDWACGFELEYEDVEKVQDCFYDVSKEVKPWTKLDKVRKLCGKRHATFTGKLSNKQDCEEAGDSWGKLSRKPTMHY
jgi:hypothetical protein